MTVSLRKNIIYNSVGSFANMFCQWIITVLVIRLSGEIASGVLALAMSFGSMFLIVAAFGIKTYQVSDIEEKYSDQEYIGAKIITAIIGLVSMSIWIVISSYYAEEKIASILYIFYMLIFSYSDVLYGILQRKWRLDIAGISMTLRSILTLITFIVVQLITQNLNYTLVVMIVVSLLVLVFYDFPKTKKLSSIKPKLNFNVLRGILPECLPLAMYTILHTLVLTVPKLFLREFHGQTFLGIYNPIMAPITVIAVVAGFVINPMVTVFAKHLSEKNHRNLYKNFLKCVALLLGLLVISLVGVKLFGNLIIMILIGSGKSMYTYLLSPMVIVSVLTSFVILLGNFSVVLRDIKGLMISGVFGFIVTIVSSYIFVYEYDMIGTCYALITALTAQAVVLIIAISLDMKKRGKNGEKSA